MKQKNPELTIGKPGKKIDHRFGIIEGESIYKILDTGGPRTKVEIIKSIQADDPAEFKPGDRVEIINLDTANENNIQTTNKSQGDIIIVNSLPHSPVPSFKGGRWYKLIIELDD